MASGTATTSTALNPASFTRTFSGGLVGGAPPKEEQDRTEQDTVDEKPAQPSALYDKRKAGAPSGPPMPPAPAGTGASASAGTTAAGAAASRDAESGVPPRDSGGSAGTESSAPPRAEPQTSETGGASDSGRSTGAEPVVTSQVEPQASEAGAPAPAVSSPSGAAVAPVNITADQRAEIGALNKLGWPAGATDAMKATGRRRARDLVDGLKGRHPNIKVDAYQAAVIIARQDTAFNRVGRLDNQLFVPAIWHARQASLNAEGWRKTSLLIEGGLMTEEILRPAFYLLDKIFGNGRTQPDLSSTTSGELADGSIKAVIKGCVQSKTADGFVPRVAGSLTNVGAFVGICVGRARDCISAQNDAERAADLYATWGARIGAFLACCVTQTSAAINMALKLSIAAQPGIALGVSISTFFLSVSWAISHYDDALGRNQGERTAAAGQAHPDAATDASDAPCAPEHQQADAAGRSNAGAASSPTVAEASGTGAPGAQEIDYNALARAVLLQALGADPGANMQTPGHDAPTT